MTHDIDKISKYTHFERQALEKFKTILKANESSLKGIFEVTFEESEI
jgi:hypothetical protein